MCTYCRSCTKCTAESTAQFQEASPPMNFLYNWREHYPGPWRPLTKQEQKDHEAYMKRLKDAETRHPVERLLQNESAGPPTSVSNTGQDRKNNTTYSSHDVRSQGIPRADRDRHYTGG